MFVVAMDTKLVTFSTILVVFTSFPVWTSTHNVQGEALELQGQHPIFLPTPTFYKAHVGDRVVLQCAVQSLENLRVIWRKATDPNPLTVGLESFYEENERIRVEHIPSEQQWNLVIKHVQLTDNGLYECQISSRLRHLRHHVLLTVKEREEQTSEHPRPGIRVTGSKYVENKGRLYLICNATGLEHSPEDLDWFLDGNKLPNSDNGRVIIRKDVSLTSKTIVSSLEIKEARQSDTGNYVCRTSNMQIENMMVTVLNAETTNVKRGTIADKSDNSGHGNSGHRYGSRHGGSSGSPYRKNRTRGNSAPSERGDYFTTTISSVLAVIVMSHYWMFPS